MANTLPHHSMRRKRSATTLFRFATMMFISTIIIFSSNVSAANTRPKAPHLTVYVKRGGYVEIPLSGYDPDGDQLTARITGIPGQGKLYQLTKVYSDHGYKPAYEAKTQIKNGNTVVTGSRRRVIYVPPQQTAPLGKWAMFRYIIEDNKGGISAEGIVSVVTSTEKVLVGSDFSRGSESWSIQSNGKRVGITHERTSHGKLLNYFIYSTDDALSIDRTTGDDKEKWYFVAPTKFLGNHVSAYGGKLSFSLGAFAGKFNTKSLNSQRDLVVLECRTCNLGRGMRFAVRNLAFDGRTKAFSLSLTESGGWLKDPKNTLKSWTTPTQCEMVEMLSSLSSVRILGDFTKWYESVGLDNVKLTAGRAKSGPPVKCLCTHPGTKCMS